MKEQAILVDTTHCTGCNSCTYRCIQEFGDQEIAARGIFRNVVQIKDEGMLRTQCMNCKDPQCAQKSSAFTKTSYGAVLVDPAKLTNAKEVEEACPFHAIRYDEETKKVATCNLCAHRVSEGKQPACVDACPASALQSGDYEAMVARANELATAKKLKIYGLKENGGTHVIILTKADPAVLGYPKLGKTRLKAELITDMTALPLVAGAVCMGLRKYGERRATVEKAENKEKHA
ncbi:MAG TPA: 4Fe-4S dicluster domain-containing protein [Terriglobales bacterium]|nr:4Fe-4S dicluster domain-containing protein [Terriglobales bacterium]